MAAPIDPLTDRVARTVVDAAFQVHRALGPGLLESTYEACLAQELEDRAIPYTRQVGLPLTYKGLVLETGYRLDLVVDDKVLVELKAVEALLPIHKAQTLTYLKLSGYRLGLLINFNVALIKDGIKRLVL